MLAFKRSCLSRFEDWRLSSRSNGWLQKDGLQKTQSQQQGGGRL
jgi:hypothetical protein